MNNTPTVNTYASDCQVMAAANILALKVSRRKISTGRARTRPDNN
jgi:hypothetical protein